MKQRSGSIGTAIICSCTILSKYLVILPEYMVKYVGNAAWLDILCKCLIAFIFFFLILFLYKPFAPKGLPDIFSLACGKTGSIILSYFYVVMLTLFNAFVLRLLSEALNTVMATSAPDEFFSLFILSAVFVAAFSGIRATSNLCIIIFPLLLATVFTVITALIPHYRIANIMPLFGESKLILAKGIFVKHFGFTEAVLLFFFAPLLGSYKEIRKSGIFTFAIISGITVLFTLAYCLTVPYPASKSFFLPFYQMTRMIKSGAFLQRLEPIVVFVWTSFVMCSMSILISVSSGLLEGAHRSERKRIFAPVITIITFFIAMLPKSEGNALYIYEKLLSVSTLLYPTLPVLILILARIRRRRLV